MDTGHVSIVSMQFLGWLGAAALAAFVCSLTLLRRRRRLFRYPVRLLGVLLAVTTAAAAVNAYYDYFPTVGALLGRRAADQVSAARFRELERRSGNSGPYLVAGGKRRLASPRTGAPPPMQRGVVVSFAMPGTVSGFHPRTGQVFLPPAWFRFPRPHLPVIELLHGSPGSPPDWTRGGYADVTSDAFAQVHDGLAPIIVMPDVNGGWWRDSECVDGRRGNADTYLTEDVRAAVVQRFGADPRGRAWAIGGLSEGGTCALMLSLRHPTWFGAACDFSGDEYPSTPGGYGHLFFGSPQEVAAAERLHDPRFLLATWPHQERGPALWMSLGRSDSPARTKRLLALLATAKQAGLDAVFTTVGGRHNFRVFRLSFEQALPWIVRHLVWESSPGGPPGRA